MSKPLALPAERRRQILDTLKKHGKVTVTGLSKALDTSIDTIRRDLIELEHNQALTRVHGGALLCPPPASHFNFRSDINIQQKVEIAKLTTQFLSHGQVVMIDGGTTTIEVARQIPKDLEITVVTISPPVALALIDHPNIEVILLGGNLDKRSLTVFGSETQNSLCNIHCDICILGVCSIDSEAGATTISLEEAAIKRSMIHQSSEVIVVASHEKLSTIAPFKICPITHIDRIITDTQVEPSLISTFEMVGTTVLVTNEETTKA